jgi:hypothetical protein
MEASSKPVVGNPDEAQGADAFGPEGLGHTRPPTGQEIVTGASFLRFPRLIPALTATVRVCTHEWTESKFALRKQYAAHRNGAMRG